MGQKKYHYQVIALNAAAYKNPSHISLFIKSLGKNETSMKKTHIYAPILLIEISPPFSLEK